MILYIVIGIIISFGLYLFFSKRDQKANLQTVSNQHVNNHHSRIESNHNDSVYKNGHGCCSWLVELIVTLAFSVTKIYLTKSLSECIFLPVQFVQIYMQCFE